MNRRKAVFSILGLSALTAGGVTAWKFWDVYKTPDLTRLNSKRALIAEIAETIIPETNTPGAKSVGVPDFILRMVQNCTDNKTQNTFMSGLEDLESYTIQSYNKSFIACTNPEREEILTYFENKEALSPLMYKVRKKILGQSFLYTIKNYTVIGYCSSEKGATQGLAYDYIPETFEACIPILPGQRSWATK